MPKVLLEKIVGYCEQLLKNAEFEDYPGAINGLQVQNNGTVSRVAAAVDGSTATVRLAIKAGADLLIVHHGLFWTPSHPWTGKRFELMRDLLDNNLAVYSSHLPLDAHPRLGNNRLLCDALGLKKLRPFFPTHGRPLGFYSHTTIPRALLQERLEKAAGTKAVLLAGGPAVCKRIGVVTGGAGERLTLAADQGLDTFITGEGPHWTFSQAEELGINVLYGGHYATETFGVKALAAEISRRFKLPWTFIHHPSGL